MKHALILMMLLGLSAPALAQTVPEPEGYRMEQYRARVPDRLTGARVIDSKAAHALWQSGEVAFIDVLPRPPKPKNLPEGTIWHEKSRHSIPGATWLPNVGYGAIAEVTADYFRRGLKKATGGDNDHPVAIFCRANCWMSWNAAKRALAYGYSQVYWMPDGTDGWTDNGYPTQKVTPEPAP